MSRSQRFIAASAKIAPQNSKTPERNTKVLQCKNLDVKDFLQFFQKIADEEARILRENAKAADLNNRKLRKLNGRFIKVAFNCGRFKSMFKEFVNWPELDLDYEREEPCPFASTQNIKNTAGVLNQGLDVMQEIQKNQQTPQASHTLTPGTPSGQAESRPATPSTTTFSTNLASKMTTPYNSHSVKTLSRSRRSLNAQKKPGIYCEICSKDFDNYEQHINDDKHIKYLKNSENYEELVNLVQTLPNNYPATPTEYYVSPNSSSTPSPQNQSGNSSTHLTPTLTFKSLSVSTPDARPVKIIISPQPIPEGRLMLSPETPRLVRGHIVLDTPPEHKL